MLAIVILLLLMLASLQARAAETPEPVRYSLPPPSDVLPGWVQLAGNLTVAGILWFYSRQFYTAMERKDAQLLALTDKFADLNAKTNAALEKLVDRLDHMDERRRTSRIVEEH